VRSIKLMDACTHVAHGIHGDTKNALIKHFRNLPHKDAKTCSHTKAPRLPVLHTHTHTHTHNKSTYAQQKRSQTFVFCNLEPVPNPNTLCVLLGATMFCRGCNTDSMALRFVYPAPQDMVSSAASPAAFNSRRKEISCNLAVVRSCNVAGHRPGSGCQAGRGAETVRTSLARPGASNRLGGERVRARRTSAQTSEKDAERDTSHSLRERTEHKSTRLCYHHRQHQPLGRRGDGCRCR